MKYFQSNFRILIYSLFSFSSSASYADVNWEHLLNCNNGEAIVEVDTGERRNIRLKINNSEAVEYVLGRGMGELIAGRLDRSGNFDATGRVLHGVFNLGQFTYVNFPACYSGTCTPYFFEAYRQNENLVFALRDESERFCDPYYENCSDRSSSVQVRNWIFRDCR